MVDINRIVYGKNLSEKIVSMEPGDESTEIFREIDGEVIIDLVPNKYWMLSNELLSKSGHKLKGNLHYAYGYKFDTREEFLKRRSMLKNKDVYSIYDAKEAFMVKEGFTYFKGMKPEEVSVLSFDIETTGLYHNDDSKLLLISNTFRRNGEIQRKLFAFDEFADEGEMITKWCEWVRECNPSVMLGHNINTFDLPYIQYIADQYGIDLKLGRNGDAIKFSNYTADFRVDGSRDLHYKKIKCYGREIIDTMFLAIKADVAAKKYESYGLKNIIRQENLESADRVFYDASQIRFKYTDPVEWQKIKDYCIFDSDDALKLYDLLVPSYFYMTQYIPKSFQQVIESASGSQINSIMVRAYLQDGYSIPKADEVAAFQGGISFGIPGIYRNCWKIDIKSCYPSAILINKLYSERKDPNAVMYLLTEYFTNMRFEYKRLYKESGSDYYLAMDTAAKIFINSIFGFCSAKGLNFNDPYVAAKITEYGRHYLNMGSTWATGMDLNYWNVPETDGPELEVEDA